MRKIKKVKAYTLNELLVVLLLTSLVVGMAFSILGLVQTQMNGIDQNFEKATAMHLLQQSLWISFHQHDGVWINGTENTLYFQNEIKETTYSWQQDKILKERDTFQIALKKVQGYFRGKPQDNGEVDALELLTDKNHGHKRIFVYKSNAATSTINR